MYIDDRVLIPKSLDDNSVLCSGQFVEEYPLHNEYAQVSLLKKMLYTMNIFLKCGSLANDMQVPKKNSLFFYLLCPQKIPMFGRF